MANAGQKQQQQPMKIEANQDQYNPELRNDELSKIYHLCAYLYNKFFGKKIDLEADKKKIDLDESNDLAGLVHTLYTCLRKRNNANVGAVGNLGEAREMKVGNAIFTVGNTAAEYIGVNGYRPFDFQIATPLIDMLTSFKLVWNEIRLSCAHFTHRAINGVTRVKKLAEIGLSNEDIPNLSGITFKPERRSGLIRTLGPLTLMIFLAQENRYPDKMKNALIDSIKMLPMGEVIADLFARARGLEETGKVLQATARVLMVMGSRSHHKIHFPILFFARSFAHYRADTLLMNFSGIAGIMFFQKTAPKFEWTKRSNGMAEDIAQVAFHSVFGTAREDFGILSAITNQRGWKTRKELNEVFKNQLAAPKKTFTFPKYTYVPRLAGANMLKGLETLRPQISAEVVFAGKRKRNYSEAFIEAFEREQMGQVYSTDPNHLAQQINEFRMRIARELREGKHRNLGTVPWLKVVGDELEEDDSEFAKTGVFMYT